MIRALFLLIVSFISITTFGQKPFKYAGRGIQMTEMWADSVARIPSDTVRNKTGIARIDARFFVGNGTFWTEIAGGSGTGANIYNTSGQITGSRIVDINGNTLTFTNGGAPADMLFDNGTQFIEMSTTHDWVNIFNGHTSLKVIDGINVNMVNTGTASMRTDSLPQNQQRIYQFPNRAGTIALTSDTAGLRELIGGKVDSVTFTSSTCVDTINVYRAGVKTQKTFDKVNGLLSGGEVTPGANDTTFNVAAAVYNAQCVRYTSDATPITLNGNSDSAKGRIDVIYTQAGNVGAIQGQNLTNPIAPALTASQIGLATVTFYPFADTGVVNIYNTTNVNGIDSSAIRSVAVTADSSAFIFTSLRRVDTIYTSRSTAIDSLRRLAGSTNVQARKGGVWITQFTDSVGSGTSNAFDSLKLTNSTNGSGIDTVLARKNGTFVPQFTLNAHVDATANNKFARTYSGVIRATTTAPSAAITWAFLDSTTGHQSFGFDSVNGSLTAIRVYYPKVKNVSSFIIAPDETLASAGVIVGASVGDSVANCFAYITTQNAGRLTGNGTTWTNVGLTYTGLAYTSSTGITTFTPTTSTGTIYAGSPEIEGTIIISVGDTMRYIERVYSGLGGNTVGFRMRDSIGRIDTGSLSSSHKVAIVVPRTKTVGINAETSSSNGFPNDLYVSTANYWIIAQMDVYMIASATSTTTATIEWQTADVPTNIYATNYRITRATVAAPTVETTIFDGWGFSYLDTGLTANTRYIYRMYATISGTERLITNEKIKTF